MTKGQKMEGLAHISAAVAVLFGLLFFFMPTWSHFILLLHGSNDLGLDKEKQSIILVQILLFPTWSVKYS